MTSIVQDEMDISGKIAPSPEPAKPTEEILAVVIGRFQIPHFGHNDLIEAAMSHGKTLLLVGSATESRGLDNPLTYEERARLIEEMYPAEIAEGRLAIEPLRDMKYRDGDWSAQVERKISNHVVSLRIEDNTKIYKPVIISVFKDEETKECMNWFGCDVIEVKQTKNIDATKLRDIYFADEENITSTRIGVNVRKNVIDFLQGFKKTEHFERLKAERKAVVEQQKKNAEIKRINGFEPIYVACDGLVVWKDHWDKPHLLVGVRKGPIGKGKFALIGGYVNAGERIIDAIRREGSEESGNNYKKFVLAGVEVFDHPKRSKRGHMITHVHHFWTKSDFPPSIMAGDDIESVSWVPFDKIAGMQTNFFADHYHIIAKMLPVVEKFNG